MGFEAESTVLDRLLVDLARDGEIGVSVRDVHRASIERDLEVLLNSRLPSGLVTAEFPECATSILNFGVPEFDNFGNLASSTEQQKMCTAFEQAIGIFEPRLQNVTVRLLAGRERDNLLRLQIEGTLTANGEIRRFEAGIKPYAGFITVSPGGSV